MNHTILFLIWIRVFPCFFCNINNLFLDTVQLSSRCENEMRRYIGMTKINWCSFQSSKVNQKKRFFYWRQKKLPTCLQIWSRHFHTAKKNGTIKSSFLWEYQKEQILYRENLWPWLWFRIYNTVIKFGHIPFFVFYWTLLLCTHFTMQILYIG